MLIWFKMIVLIIAAVAAIMAVLRAPQEVRLGTFLAVVFIFLITMWFIL